MKIRKVGTAAVALTAAAMAVTAGTANARTIGHPGPRPVNTIVAPGVSYTDDLPRARAVLATPIGSVTMQAGRFDIRDAGGRTVAGTPLPAPASKPASVPDARVRTATLTSRSPARPVDTMANLGQAVEAAGPHMGLAWGLGSAVGAVGGMIVGCPLGAITGGGLVTPFSLGTLTLPAAAAGCLVGAVIAGGAGAALGGVILAVPVGIAAGVQRYNELQARPVDSTIDTPVSSVLLSVKE